MKIDPSQIIFQILNFSVVLGALTYLLYKPILKMFAERAKRIEEGQKAAQKAIEQQSKIEEITQKTEAEAKKKAASVLKEATQEAEVKKAELLEEARAVAAAEVEKMKQAWKSEKEQLVSKIRTEVVETVMSASEKVLGKSIDAKTHSAVIDEELAKVLKTL
jgi:F-type H+-transporting ATPase subunit b